MKQMKEALILLLAFLAGCMMFGCRQPVRNYRITTGSPDVWAAQPKQKVEFTVEWKQ
jgi:hypothetical protein